MSIRRLDEYRGKLFYLDTNILIYFAEGFARHKAVLEDLVSRLENGEAHALTSEVTLMEALVRPIREQNLRMVTYYEQFLGRGSVLRMIPVDRAILRRAAELRGRTTLKPLDAIHVATAHLCGCDMFISDDRGLSSLPLPNLTLEELGQ